MIKAVVFDYGGVLATSQWDAFAEFERRLGLPPGGLAPFFGIDHPDNPGVPAWQVVEIGAMAWRAFAELVVDAAARGGVTIPTVDDVNALMPLGALWPMVHRAGALKDEGFKLAILTNNVREFGAYWKATVPIELFDVVVDSCEEGVRKPDPEIYRRTADRLGVEVSECLFLDDGAANCEAAAAVGMSTVLVGPDVSAAVDALDAALTRSHG